MNDELVPRPKEREVFLCEIKVPPEIAAYFEPLTAQIFKDFIDRVKRDQQSES